MPFQGWFASGFHVEFVDLDGPFQRGTRRIQHSQEALDAAVDGFVGDINLNVELSDAGVQPDVGVESEKPLPESDRRGRSERFWFGVLVRLLDD